MDETLSTLDRLIAAVTKIQNGLTEVKAVLSHEKESDAYNPNVLIEELTKRQRDIILLVGKKHTNGEIAKQLGISHRTVEANLNTIRQFMKFESMYELRKFAETLG